MLDVLLYILGDSSYKNVYLSVFAADKPLGFFHQQPNISVWFIRVESSNVL